MGPFTAAKLLLLVALVLFVLSAFGVGFPGVSLVPLGLAFMVSSYLAP